MWLSCLKTLFICELFYPLIVLRLLMQCLSFSETNLDNLYPELKNTIVEATPIAVEIYVNPTTNPAMDPLVMGTIGYTSGDYTPHNLKVMKPEVLARVIDDPGLLTYLFPNLDPWGIGGFNELNRRPDQISFDRQAEVNKNTSFAISQHEQNSIVEEMQSVRPMLTDMIATWECNSNTKPSNQQQKQALKLLQCLKHAAKDLKGSFAGLTPKQWANMTAFECGVFVSNNPGSAAIFFDTLIKAFLTIVVRYGCGAGLFGTCLAHYGMVEAQGRGSLHCHMLLWLKGNLAPQDLHDHMSADDGFKTLMFTWLESIIHSHLPGEDALQTKTPGEPLHRPCKAHIADPCLNDELKSVNMTNEDFAIAFCQTVRDLAIECNWHKHTDTCWKYLKPDIKFISSGESAKAFVYYVTKYITKSSLAAHISLAAVLYAIQQNNKKFQGLQPMAGTVNKSWFTKTVNAIMTRQELSHQQVMSYLVGGGDHYTSHTYKMIKWQQFDKYMATHFKASQQDDLSSHSIQLEDDSSQIGPEIELYIDDDLHKLPETDF
ncbi:hypothetical protein SERLADRAFT_405892 [Serpula lacrymans var. lacrymans S7.9]|uniref:Helitron helicase-like domain-containing protein n=1 Tax=Serpula lacrymans var. lacrymans (strain S7.9) TaxID=578457 RepID=F8NJY0_SERL9|nr:uncharacterized protein SERLADRAFT_405892 [Serpula lacrymans var. lacrymans S7.9]EGO28292.1 hypothetical protein SERLADRAFT_405892 [Serpula lacrymans var. lacrymans S7.9]